MDDQNKGMRERWAPGSRVPERGYADEPGYSSSDPDTDAAYRGDRAVEDHSDEDRDTTKRTREIRSEIDRTRTEMSGTIDAIQDRLSPRNVVSRAAENVRDATIGRAREFANQVQDSVPRFGNRGGAFVDRLRDHPFAAAVAGASLAWLAFGGRQRGGDDYGRAIYGSTRGEPYIRETRIDLAEDGDAAMSTQGRQGFSTAGERPWRSMQSRRERWNDAGIGTADRVRQAAEQNPFAAAAVAAGVGLAIGLMFPATERENQVMGEARDSLMEKGRETVRDAAEKVKETAGEVQKVATRALGATESESSTVKGADNP